MEGFTKLECRQTWPSTNSLCRASDGTRGQAEKGLLLVRGRLTNTGSIWPDGIHSVNNPKSEAPCDLLSYTSVHTEGRSNPALPARTS